jgi:hypothetical protein
MHPPHFPSPYSSGRRAEKHFYEACRNLDSSWVVLYNVAWYGPRDGRSETSDADFVLIHAQFGIFVVEVKGGEEITVRDGRWRSKPHGGFEAVDIKDPFLQAAQSKRTLFDYLRRNVPGLTLNGSFGHFVAFPGHIQRGDMALHAPRVLICDRNDINDFSTFMETIAKHFNQKHKLNDEQVEAIVQCLLPSFDIGGSSALDMATLMDGIDFLTNLQLSALEYVMRSQRATVIGPAGSGKTILAFHHTKHLASQGSDVLHVVHTSELADHLRAQVDAFPADTAENITIVCLYELGEMFVDDLLRYRRSLFPEAETFDTGFFEACLQAIWSNDDESLLEDAGLHRAQEPWRLYNAIVVDEAQFLHERFVPYLELIVRNSDNIHFYGDPQQSYDWNYPKQTFYRTVTSTYEHSALRRAVNGNEWKLNINCRSSVEVAEFCSTLITEPSDTIGTSGGVVEQHRASVAEVIDLVPSIITRWVKDFNISPSEVEILFINPLILNELPAGLEWDGLRIYDDFAITWNPEWEWLDTPEEVAVLEARHAEQLRAAGNLPNLRPKYFGQLVGRESKAVIVLAHDRGPFTAQGPLLYETGPTGPDYPDGNSLLYTAASRAQALLAVISDN